MASLARQRGPLLTELEDELYKYTFQRKWDKIVEFYEKEAGLHCTKFTSSKDTALHMAINDDQEDIVERMVGIIMENDFSYYLLENPLQMKNDRGETPLHRAAAMGSVKMCECIVTAGNGMYLDLLAITNKEGETPIFMAALHNRKHAFLCLHYASINYYPPENRDIGLRRRNVYADTVLHSAIKRDHFDLAFHIIRLYPLLLHLVNAEGTSPLHVLAKKPSAFRSGSHLSWWRKIIYYYIYVDRLKYDPTIITTPRPQPRSQEGCPENYQTCYEFLASCYSALRSVLKSPWFKSSRKKEESDPENLLAGETSSDNKYNENIPQIYATCHQFLAFVFETLFGLSGFGKTFTDIKNMKEKHAWTVRILNELTERSSTVYNIDGGNPGGDPGEIERYFLRPDMLKICRSKLGEAESQRYSQSEWETLILIAAKNGVTEIVEKILDIFPAAVDFTDSEGKNIVQLAVENRQLHLYQFLLERSFLRETMFRKVDNDGNNVLHLAAKLPDYKPWLIPSAALQMQWEIKLFEFVKESSSPYVSSQCNKSDETPEDIFTKTHKGLVESGGEWINKISKSCSVVAALIATVAFATMAAVPGGVQEGTGLPTLENETAFKVYAISSLISVFCSVTSVVMFLYLLTSRHQEQDFGKDLPRKLLIALTSMFLSIASILVSFCTAHFFMVRNELRHVLPLYFVGSLPVTLFALAQLPLYFAFLWAAFVEVPPHGWYRVTPAPLKTAQEKNRTSDPQQAHKAQEKNNPETSDPQQAQKRNEKQEAQKGYEKRV